MIYILFFAIGNLSVSNGLVVSYVHNAIAANLGKIGVLVAFESKAAKEKFQKVLEAYENIKKQRGFS